MNFDFWISQPEYMDGALDLICFLLRFYTQLDYDCFSDKADIINILKRAEMYKCWNDLEELAGGVQTFHQRCDQTLDKHKASIEGQNAKIGKIEENIDTLNIRYNDVKSIVDRIADKTQNDLKNEIIDECRGIVKIRMDEMVDLVEKFATLVKTTERKQKEFEQHIEQKYALQSSRKDQIEDILKDHIELIKKLHSQQQGCTTGISDLDKKYESKISELKSDMSMKSKFHDFEKTLKEFEGKFDELKVDQKSFKSVIDDELASWKQISNNMINETNAQMKVFDKNLNKLSMPELEKIEEKIQFVEQEIVNLKNAHFKTSSAIKPASSEGLSPTKMVKTSLKIGNEELKSFSEELDEISLFIQRFADAHIFDQVRIIKDPDASIKAKMDTLDWVARNSEFLSTDAISNCLKEFKELYSPHNEKSKEEYIKSRNHSLAITNILQQIEHTAKLPPGDDTDYKISLLYSILEPLLVNEFNLSKALDLEVVDTVMRTLTQSLEQMEGQKVKCLIYQKYVLRCLTSCMRSEKVVMTFVKDDYNIEIILNLIKKVKDEEILANANKILRVLLRDDYNLHEQMVDNRKNKKKEFNNPKVFLGLDENLLSLLVNSLLEQINVHDFSEIVLVEATAAILNFVKRQELVKFIIPQNLAFLVNVVMENYEKPRVLAIQCLQHIANHSEYKEHIKQLGADDILQINV